MAHYLFYIETSDNPPKSVIITAASKEAGQDELKRRYPNSVKITLTEELDHVTGFDASSGPPMGMDPDKATWVGRGG